MDVTKLELLTRELRRREAYLAEAQRLSHTGSFAWNVSTDEHFWSDETFRIFEFDPSSKVSLQMILECVHPQDMPSVKINTPSPLRSPTTKGTPDPDTNEPSCDELNCE